MVFNVTFNNISVITYIVVVSFIDGGNWQTLSYNVVSTTPCHERGSNSQL
jgi:hypothetical protein